MSDIGYYINECHSIAKDKGWWEKDRDIPELLCLIHSEVSEALEDYRSDNMEVLIGVGGKPEGFPVELADILIRIFDLCGHLGINLDDVLTHKIAFNRNRPYRHGNKLA